MKFTKYNLNNIIPFLLFALFLPINIWAQDSDPYKNIKYFELNNGLKVYMLADKKAINTQIELVVKVGTDIENKNNAGISHLVEHLIFRDKRIPYRDYLDHIKEKGATYVNGYTKRYTSGYTATIDSNQSYWLVETFSQMLFDKVVDKEDLEIEKRALQVEIGEFQWYHSIGNSIRTLFKSIGKLFPDDENIYIDEFGIEKPKDLTPMYYSKKNNYNFTLDEVLEHYDAYYYPKNMILKIVGNFDAGNMESVIKKYFGNVTKTGTKTVQEPPYNATLNHTPHSSYVTGAWDKDYAYIGSKYILDDYKKYLIIDAYTEYLASKMQQLLRNKLGQTYSVNSFHHSNKNAILTGVEFSSLHQDFGKSISLVKEKIADDSRKMNLKEIHAALKQSSLYYSSVEHDSTSLFDLLKAKEYIDTYHQLYDETPYSIFTTITTQDFQNTISEVFSKENAYSYIYNDYYFFPYDMQILTLIMFIILIFLFRKSYKYILTKKDRQFYTKREILWNRRLTNPFVSFVKFVFIFMTSIILSEWCEYALYNFLTDDPYFPNHMASPYDYFFNIVSFIWFMIVFLLINHYLFSRSFSRLDITDKSINFIGSRWHEVKKETILSMETVPWSIDKIQNTFGMSLLFFKPLVAIVTTNGRVIYLRSSNAQHLKEDLEKWSKNKE